MCRCGKSLQGRSIGGILFFSVQDLGLGRGKVVMLWSRVSSFWFGCKRLGFLNVLRELPTLIILYSAGLKSASWIEGGWRNVEHEADQMFTFCGIELGRV